MVYCTKCGTENEDEALNCVNCGTPLQAASPREKDWEERIERNWEARLERGAEEFGRRMEKECFGLPGGGAIFGILFGVIVIFFGLQLLYGWDINIWPFAVIIVGILFVVGALYGFSQRRR